VHIVSNIVTKSYLTALAATAEHNQQWLYCENCMKI